LPFIAVEVTKTMLKAGLAVAVGVGVIVGVAVCDGVAVAVEVGVAVVVAAVPVAVAVAVCVAVAVAVGVAVIDTANPIPPSFTFCGLFAATSVNSSRPLKLPLFAGLKKTDTGQLPDGWMVLVHPFMSRLKPVPVTLTPGAGRSALLLLVSVTIFALLWVPAGTLPKFIFFVDRPTTGLLVDAELDCAIATLTSA